ncbi:MAG: hypothetical protein ACYSUK_00005 [Planctomycetota bacterium]
MTAYTFIMDAAVTVDAENEQEARELLKTATLEEDVFLGSCGVYIPPDQEPEIDDVWPVLKSE